MKPFLHDRIFNALLLELSSGYYLPGKRFLSLRQVTKKFGISKPTAMQAMDRLKAEGFLSPKARSGFLVTPGAASKAMLLLRNQTASSIPAPRSWMTTRSRILQKIQPPPKQIAIIYCANPPGKKVHFPQQFPNPSLRCSQGCMQAAAERHVSITFSIYDGTPQQHENLKKMLTAKSFSGLLIIQRSSNLPDLPQLVTPLLKKGISVVTTFGDVQNTDIPKVDFNNIAAGFEATQTLIQAGAPEIQILVCPNMAPSNKLRLQGAKLAARQSQIPLRVLRFPYKKNSFQNLNLFPLPSKSPKPFFLSFSWDLAVAVCAQAHQHKLKPGRHFSILAFSSISQPPAPLSPIDIMFMDFDYVGQLSVNTLLDHIEGTTTHRSIPVSLPHHPQGSVKLLKNTKPSKRHLAP